MNLAHLHLLLNHFPIIGTAIGLGIFLGALFEKNNDLKRIGMIVLAAMALLAIPAFLCGTGAAWAIKESEGVSEALIERHQGAAMLAFLCMEITGAIALAGLWQLYRHPGPARWNKTLAAVLLFSIVTVSLMARVGTTGGDIRHPEIWSSPEATPTDDSGISRFVHAFEPSPPKFADLMVISKWWWAFMMDLHFIGLALLIGTIGVLNLRLLGFAKQLPIAPLHRLVPWALVGFGINLLTGALAYTGMAAYYTFNLVFWLKMLGILLLGLNAAAFYLTDAFQGVEHLGPGENAPARAKFIAGTSLFLWFAVITLGRYIQLYSDTIPIPGQ